VIAPDPGVIIIEVKGWFLDTIAGGNHSEITINADDRERKEIHPPGQARNYRWGLPGHKKLPEKSPQWDGAGVSGGNPRGKKIITG
jgi:hypothetical protein